MHEVGEEVFEEVGPPAEWHPVLRACTVRRR